VKLNLNVYNFSNFNNKVAVIKLGNGYGKWHCDINVWNSFFSWFPFILSVGSAVSLIFRFHFLFLRIRISVSERRKVLPSYLDFRFFSFNGSCFSSSSSNFSDSCLCFHCTHAHTHSIAKPMDASKENCLLPLPLLPSSDLQGWFLPYSFFSF